MPDMRRACVGHLRVRRAGCRLLEQPSAVTCAGPRRRSAREPRASAGATRPDGSDRVSRPLPSAVRTPLVGGGGGLLPLRARAAHAASPWLHHRPGQPLTVTRCTGSLSGASTRSAHVEGTAENCIHDFGREGSPEAGPDLECVGCSGELPPAWLFDGKLARPLCYPVSASPRPAFTSLRCLTFAGVAYGPAARTAGRAAWPGHALRLPDADGHLLSNLAGATAGVDGAAPS